MDDEWVVVPSTTELVARITLRTKRIAKSEFDDMCVRVARRARDPKKLVRHLLVLMVVSCVLGSVASFAAARLGSHGLSSTRGRCWISHRTRIEKRSYAHTVGSRL